MSMNGTVLTGRNNIFTVLAEDSLLVCRIKGKTLVLEERAYNPLAPGDEVRLSSIDMSNRTAVIEARLPRRNAFERYNHKRAALQTLAANVDLVVPVMSAVHPSFRNRFVDRVLALAEYQGIEAFLVITKSDLDPERAELESERYGDIGYSTVTVRSDRRATFDRLEETLRGLRSVFVGQSGVGKSTLVNTLVGSELQRIGEISTRYLGGTHTTNAAVLVQHGDVEIVDTPGVRELDCRDVPREALDHTFREFRPFLGACALTDCYHEGEPGCAVREAVATGAIDADRYESYLRLSEELAELQEDHP